MAATLPPAWDVGSCAARSDLGHSMAPTLSLSRLRSASFMAPASPEPLAGPPTPAPEADDSATEERVSRSRSTSWADTSRRSRQWGHGPTCWMSRGCGSSGRSGRLTDVGGRATGGSCDGRVADGTRAPLGPCGPVSGSGWIGTATSLGSGPAGGGVRMIGSGSNPITDARTLRWAWCDLKRASAWWFAQGRGFRDRCRPLHPGRGLGREEHLEPHLAVPGDDRPIAQELAGSRGPFRLAPAARIAPAC